MDFGDLASRIRETGPRTLVVVAAMVLNTDEWLFELGGVAVLALLFLAFVHGERREEARLALEVEARR